MNVVVELYLLLKLLQREHLCCTKFTNVQQLPNFLVIFVHMLQQSFIIAQDYFILTVFVGNLLCCCFCCFRVTIEFWQVNLFKLFYLPPFGPLLYNFLNETLTVYSDAWQMWISYATNYNDKKRVSSSALALIDSK